MILENNILEIKEIKNPNLNEYIYKIYEN